MEIINEKEEISEKKPQILEKKIAKTFASKFIKQKHFSVRFSASINFPKIKISTKLLAQIYRCTFSLKHKREKGSFE